MDELELLKEINNLNKEITTNELFCRKLNLLDWDVLDAWWEAWPDWTNPGKEFLPENGTGGLMVEKNGIPIVAGFMYQTNSKAVLLEWIISNPEYRQEDRKQAVEMLITKAEEFCKELGFKWMFTIGRNKHLIKTHEKLGWFVDNKPSYEITKKIK